jgi:uncharacterized protein YqeY
MSLKSRIQEDVKSAMRAGEKNRLGTLRMLTAGIKQQEIDTRTELDDDAIIAVIEKMIKQRREAAEQYLAGDREDLALKEQSEASILREYLPAPLTEQEVEALIDDAISATGASTTRDIGKVMAVLKPKLLGRADVASVSGQVKARLAP